MSVYKTFKHTERTIARLLGGKRTGHLVEFGPTKRLFTNPREKRTEDYITGRFG